MSVASFTAEQERHLFGPDELPPDQLEACQELIRHHVEDKRVLIGEIMRLRAALYEIAAVQYGAELTDSSEELVAYWGDLCRRYRRIAKRALDHADG